MTTLTALTAETINLLITAAQITRGNADSRRLDDALEAAWGRKYGAPSATIYVGPAGALARINDDVCTWWDTVDHALASAESYAGAHEIEDHETRHFAYSDWAQDADEPDADALRVYEAAVAINEYDTDGVIEALDRDDLWGVYTEAEAAADALVEALHDDGTEAGIERWAVEHADALARVAEERL